MDHHHLDCLADGPFDGVYTTETLVHAPDPEKSIGRILPRDQAREGGSIVLHQIRSSRFQTLFPKTFQKNFDESMEHINKRAFDASKTSLSYMGGPASYARKTRLLQDVVCGRSVGKTSNLCMVVYSPPLRSDALFLHRPTQIIQYTHYLLI